MPSKPQKTRKVKAWAVLSNGSIVGGLKKEVYGTMWAARDAAAEWANVFSLSQTIEVVPCEITYQLPTKSPKK